MEELDLRNSRGLCPRTPQDLSLGASPDAGANRKRVDEKGDAEASLFIDRSRPLSRRSGCFPALPYPPLSPQSFYCGGIREVHLCGGF